MSDQSEPITTDICSFSSFPSVKRKENPFSESVILFITSKMKKIMSILRQKVLIKLKLTLLFELWILVLSKICLELISDQV